MTTQSKAIDRDAGQVTNKAGVRNEETERHRDIFVCRQLRQPLEVLWPRIRSFG